jgi:hypothetical protein
MLYRFFRLLLGLLSTATTVLGSVPEVAPRTWVPQGRHEDFRTFAREGAGRVYLERIRADFDAHWADYVVPDQPATYGDPDPRKRTADKVILWREAQDVCNRVATVAEAATLLWIATGETRYRDQAKRILLEVSAWDQDGVADIAYNDEAHFRLWRKLPAVYDQLRDSFTAAERTVLLEAFRERGNRSVDWIKRGGVERLRPNSVEASPSSHPVRFMAMTGVAGLALWDDLPEARDWYRFAYDWYRDRFTPWGGEDGGWAEGVAYWRGVYEHAAFQDALLLIGDPLAYATPFWRETGYFPVYFTQPYYATSFGDLSNAGKFNLEPGVWHFLRHLGRVLGNGHFMAFAELYADPRPTPEAYGLKELIRLYPTSTEYLLREFAAVHRPMPASAPLSELPPARHFGDIGWVAFHSALGQPEEDIHLVFKSSPYGSFSHSHGDQNAFILNAYGMNLAINSGYREYHRSPHHAFYTRETRSKNAVLINLRGQDVQNKAARGEILGFAAEDRLIWTAGEAVEAYQILQPQLKLSSVRRDVVMIDRRFFVLRDRLVGDKPFLASWMLHAERPITADAESGRVLISNAPGHLAVRLAPLDNSLKMRLWSGFDVAVDPAYVDPAGVAEREWLTAPNVDQHHLRVDLEAYQESSTIYTVLYPSRIAGDLGGLELEPLDADSVIVTTPASGTVRIRFTAAGAALEAP